MKLIIKEIERKTNKVIQTWKRERETMEECIKSIQKLDKQFLKNSFKFEYIIKE